MSAARDLVAALVAGGMDPIEASTLLARAAVEMTAVVIRKSPGAKRQEAWRERNKTSQNVSPRHDDEASQSVSNRLETSQRDDASLSKKERKKEESKKERAVTRASQIPEGWLPDEHVWKATVDLIGLERCNREFAKFKNHAADKGRVSKNWNSAWRNWVDKSIEYRGQNGNGKAQDNPRAGSLIGALDRAIAKAEFEENFSLEVPADNLLSLPGRSIQRS